MPRFFADYTPVKITCTCLTLAEVNAKAIGEEVPRLVELWHQLLEVRLVRSHVAPGLRRKDSNILMKVYLQETKQKTTRKNSLKN